MTVTSDFNIFLIKNFKPIYRQEFILCVTVKMYDTPYMVIREGDKSIIYICGDYPNVCKFKNSEK